MIVEFADADAQAAALCEKITQILLADIAARGKALLLLPGGSSPVKLMEALAKADLPWDKIAVTLTDERCVPLDSEYCNAAHVKTLLGVEPVYLWRDGLCEAAVRALPWPASVVVLGMGPDGHFASLFPYQKCESDDGAMLIKTEAPSEPKRRISFTLPQLMQTKTVFLLVNGAEKQAIYRRAESGDESLPIYDLIKAAGETLQVYTCE